MPRPNNAKAVSAGEAKALFSNLAHLPGLVLAVSGGPDSTALMVMAARWHKALKTKPKLIAVTVDHGLRAESKREAANVARLARKLGISHRLLRWTGRKPAAGLPQASRQARYAFLAKAARDAGAAHILTAHTLDDQAETVLIRLLRGSGMTGLGAMKKISVLPVSGQAVVVRDDKLFIVRPLLDISKARLIATLRAAKIAFADDPTNRDPRFTRARLRGLMPQLAKEGLDARRLSLLAQRLRRADAALEAVTEQAMNFLAVGAAAPQKLAFEAGGFAILPTEISLRVLGRAVAAAGDEGPVELAKLEALKSALEDAQKSGIKRFRRSLAGAMVTLEQNKITVERAPPRRESSLTKRARGSASHAKAR